jgi:2,3-bisphosphoglycerate-dependent phosphoglycerate mutase
MPAPAARGGFRLVILRHGQSEWNARNLFTGWVDVPLSAAGEQEASRAGRRLAERGLLPGFVHTSLQRRAIRTAELVLASCGRDWVPVRRSWRLNSNHYGALQGRNKAEVAAEVGADQLRRWRRRYDTPPPPLPPGAEFSQFADSRYAVIPPAARPCTESLQDVTARLLPYWYDEIVPDLHTGQCVLVATHGNTARALVKHLEQIPDAEIAGLDIPTAAPLAYELGPDLRPIGGRLSW